MHLAVRHCRHCAPSYSTHEGVPRASIHAGMASCAHRQASSEQLRLGVAHLTKRLSRSRQFYADLTKLQHDWNIQVGRWSCCGRAPSAQAASLLK
jgi:hypothetical protein